MKRNNCLLTIFILLCPVLFIAGCKESLTSHQKQTIVQFSTIDALMTGVYDGETTLSELARWGNFGIGTFNALDGEMILYNGTFYKVKSDGNIYRYEGTVQTPFATVTFFQAESSYQVTGIDYSGLKSTLDSMIASPNLFYAIRVSGTFRTVKTRSVPEQEKPYPPLIEITAHQPEFQAEEVSGILVGFYCPPFVTGINVPGYHLHFLSDDETFGGHLLELELEHATVEIDPISQFKLILPHDKEFMDADLSKDLSDDLKSVEGN
jgi:acetolactate decarboxylase